MITEQEWIENYRKHIKPLYRYVSRRTGGERGLTEDLVQETWLRALRDWQRKGLPREPMAWLTTVARNLLASYYRKSPSQPNGDTQFLREDEPEPVRSPENAALLHRALERLRPKQIDLIEAFHFDGKSILEIAGELGISERAVEGRLRRAREALRSHLGGFVPKISQGVSQYE